MSKVDYLSALNTKGSGLNITQIVDALVDAEKTPQTSLIEKKIETNNISISAIAEIKNALSTLSTSLTNLVGKTSLAVSSNSTAVTASITDPSKVCKCVPGHNSILPRSSLTSSIAILTTKLAEG